MAWYLNKALTNFREEVNRRYPSRDKSSDGTIGDTAHQATTSDHNPDPDGSVDAWDMDVELNGPGKPYDDDLRKVINAAIKHEAIQYIIYNRKITSRSWGLGVWKTYTGSNPHDKHVHFNTRTSHEKSNKPWLEEEDMPLSDSDMPIIRAAIHSTQIGRTGETFGVVMDRLRSYDEDIEDVKESLATLAEKVESIVPATGDVIVTVSDEQLERVLRNIIGSVDE